MFTDCERARVEVWERSVCPFLIIVTSTKINEVGQTIGITYPPSSLSLSFPLVRPLRKQPIRPVRALKT